MTSIEIPSRFRGPPRSANGGYACGVVASAVDADVVEVTLRKPPPLDTSMRFEPRGDGVALMLGDQLIGEGKPATLDLDLIDPVTFEQAESATERFLGSTDHLFPGCFVCGPERDPGDGLRLFPGSIDGRDAVASPWTAGVDVTDEIVWAALDCPSYFGPMAARGVLAKALLGRLTGRIWRRPTPGERCVVMGWSRGSDGRKIRGASAVFSADGEPLAASAATWIEVDELPV